MFVFQSLLGDNRMEMGRKTACFE